MNLKSLRKFARNISGNTSIFFAIAAVPLLLTVGVAVDMSRASRTQTVLQGAVDAATLAAGNNPELSNNEMKAIIDQYLASNGAKDAVLNMNKPQINLDKKAGELTVSVSGTINTSLMKLVGIGDMKIGAVSQVNLGIQALEVALVLDNTGSMAGQKIADLKSSAKLLVSILNDEKSQYSLLRFGVVPFSQHVNVGLANRNAMWINVPPDTPGATWGGCVGSRPAPLDEDIKNNTHYTGVSNVTCPSPISPLTSDLTMVNQELDSMVAIGNTFIPGGLLWGWNVLTDDGPYNQALNKHDREDRRGKRALVLMTDGANTASPNNPANTGSDVAYSNGLTTRLCEAIKAEDIEVYTIAFQVPDVTIKDILEKCATSPEKAYDAANGKVLEAAFRSIAAELSALRLTR